MTVQKMLAALPVLNRMMELKLPIKKAYKIFALVKNIAEQKEFFINEEKKMIAKYDVQFSAGGGLQFKSAEDQAKFVEEHNALMLYQVEGLECIELTFADLGDIEFTPADIAALDGVVVFID